MIQINTKYINILCRCNIYFVNFASFLQLLYFYYFYLFLYFVCFYYFHYIFSLLIFIHFFLFSFIFDFAWFFVSTALPCLVGNMHVVINPELVMEVEARMNRAYLPSRLLPPTHLRGSTLPHHRKSSLYHTSTGNFCTFVNL